MEEMVKRWSPVQTWSWPSSTGTKVASAFVQERWHAMGAVLLASAAA